MRTASDSTVRSKIAGERHPSTAGTYSGLPQSLSRIHVLVPGYAGHYWGKGQRFGLIDIGGGMAYWWGSKNMPVAQARDWRGGKAEILAAFDGWAPEVVEVIERTPDHAIVSVPAPGSAVPRAVGQGAGQPARGRGAPDADQHVARRKLGGGGRLRAGGGDRTGIRSRCGAERYEDMRRDARRMLVRSSRRYSRLEQAQNPVACAARDLGVRCAPTRVADAAHHPSNAVRPGVGCGMQTEAAAPAQPGRAVVLDRRPNLTV